MRRLTRWLPPSAMNADKKEARRRARAAAAGLDSAYLEECDRVFTARILELQEYKTAKRIFCYVGYGTEPDTRAFLQRALEDGKTVAVPRVCGAGVMRAHVIKALSQLVPGTFGIPEPSENTEMIEPEETELAVVPALVFDREGYRLGHGGGYYDRFLSRTGAFTVGLERELLLLDRVPRDSWDLPVKGRSTENKTARLP